MNFLKQVIGSVIVGSSLLFLSPHSALALKVEDVPNPRQVNGGWVSDLADLLSPEAEGKLNKMISDLVAKNGTEIAIVTVSETAPYHSSKELATELFNYWGIGKKDKNNGVLFLVSISDRRIEIETGYGIVAVLPNSEVQKIIARDIIPQFKQGKFESGIINGTKYLIIELDGEENITNKINITIKNTIVIIILAVIFIGIGGYYGAIYTSRGDSYSRTKLD